MACKVLEDVYKEGKLKAICEILYEEFVQNTWILLMVQLLILLF